MAEVTEETVLDLLKPEKFKAWLESKRPLSWVGQSQMAESCPLARYLQNQTGQYIEVGNNTINDLYTVLAKKPDWVKRFTTRVDHPASKRKMITARTALLILDEVEQEVAG